MDTAKKISQQLKEVYEVRKNDVVGTCQLNVAEMAKDAADTIDSLNYIIEIKDGIIDNKDAIIKTYKNKIDNNKAFIDLINSLPTCNDCVNTRCTIRPKLGTTVRYNCWSFQKRDEEVDAYVEKVELIVGFKLNLTQKAIAKQVVIEERKKNNG